MKITDKIMIIATDCKKCIRTDICHHVNSPIYKSLGDGWRGGTCKDIEYKPNSAKKLAGMLTSNNVNKCTKKGGKDEGKGNYNYNCTGNRL